MRLVDGLHQLDGGLIPRGDRFRPFDDLDRFRLFFWNLPIHLPPQLRMVMVPHLPRKPMGTMDPQRKLMTLWLRNVFRPESFLFEGWSLLLDMRRRLFRRVVPH